MSTVFSIIGVIAVVVLVLLVGFVGWFIYAARAMARLNNMRMPLTVKLKPDPKPDWIQLTPYAEAIANLKQKGFRFGEPQIIEGMPQSYLIAFFGNFPGCGIIYKIPTVDYLYVDITAIAADGTSYTVTNATVGQQMDTAPDRIQKYFPKAGVGELIEAMRQLVAGIQTVPITEENYVRHFESEYIRSMLWRYEKGGVSREEFMKIAALQPNMTEEQLEFAYRLTKHQEVKEIHEAVLEALKASNLISAQSWEDNCASMLVFWDKLHPVGYAMYLAEEIGIEETQQQTLLELADSGISSEALRQRAFDMIADKFKITPLVTMDKPVPATIYLWESLENGE